jgi:allantoin racemase
MMKLWYQSTVDLAETTGYRDALTSHFAKVKAPDTDVELHGRGRSEHRLRMNDIVGSPIAYHRLAAPVYVDNMHAAQQASFDAFIIGSFSEPLVPELRSLATIPLVTMPEASMLIACMLAPSFALVTLNQVSVPYINKSVKLHQLGERISGVYVVDERMDEEELDTQFRSPEGYLARFRTVCRRAIADGAQAIVPAEGMLAVMVAESGITEIDGAPVVDAIGGPILFAEMAVRLRRQGLRHSPLAYPAPTAAAMRAMFGG